MNLETASPYPLNLVIREALLSRMRVLACWHSSLAISAVCVTVVVHHDVGGIPGCGPQEARQSLVLGLPERVYTARCIVAGEEGGQNN